MDKAGWPLVLKALFPPPIVFLEVAACYRSFVVVDDLGFLPILLIASIVSTNTLEVQDPNEDMDLPINIIYIHICIYTCIYIYMLDDVYVYIYTESAPNHPKIVIIVGEPISFGHTHIIPSPTA